MATVINNIYLQNGFVEVEIISDEYRVLVKVDKEFLSLVGKMHLTNSGYIKTKGELLHRVVMNRQKGDKTFVDHINGDKLDNRSSNLRVVTDSVNKRNLHTFKRNNTGVIGVQYRENGNYKYYRVSYRDLDGKRGTKQFNISQLGDELAFKEAVSFLQQMSEKYLYI